jgi:hypothetical protein
VFAPFLHTLARFGPDARDVLIALFGNLERLVPAIWKEFEYWQMVYGEVRSRRNRLVDL